jgi:3-hydroxyisobutyrate dehydrogenase-like beta-hydroxyacid dehydrogenase
MAPAVTRVSVVGVGKMGEPIAERILDAGFELAVWNRTAPRCDPLVQRGATLLDWPAAALAGRDLCITMLADDAALDEIAIGVLAGADASTVMIDMSTVSVAASERVAARAEARGVAYLRAPVSGNPGVVRAGNLTIVVSGPAHAINRADALLHAIGPKVITVGDAEQARVVKLVLQIMIAGIAELLAEGLVLGEAAGVDRKTLLDAIAQSVVASRFSDYKTAPILQDDYSATFTTAMMLKDIDLVLELAADVDATLPLATQLRELLDGTAAAGYADRDFMALYLQLREREPTATRNR